MKNSPVTVVRRSQNRKLSTDRACNATYVSQSTCPASCPFYGQGCYAEGGEIRYTTANLNKAREQNPTRIARREAKAILSLDSRFPLRLHVVGDCKTKKSAEIVSEACMVYSSKHGQKVWGYTHNRLIPRASWGTVSILRSCTSLRQAEGALQAGFAATLIVPEFKSDKRYYIGRGMYGIPCPVQTGKCASCVDCKLCMKDDTLRKHNNVILIKAHGYKTKKVVEILMKENTNR